MNLERRDLFKVGGAVVAAGIVAAEVSGVMALSMPDLSGREIEKRLQSLGIDLPDPGQASMANFVPTLTHRNTLLVSGQIPLRGEILAYRGRVGSDLNLEEAYDAARIVGINMLALVKRHLSGNLDRIRSVVRIDGFVSSAPDFFEQEQVIGGISDLMLEVFGDAGRHTRTAVGVHALRLNAPCEISAEFSV